jgi:hypothetical protein
VLAVTNAILNTKDGIDKYSNAATFFGVIRAF